MFNHIMIKNFPKNHDLHKLINKNNCKISYSCTPNIGMIIAGHNKKILKKYHEKKNNRNPTIARLCNCRVRADCPLNGNCLKKDVLYKAKVSADDEPVREYTGLTATTFKVRHANHKTSFNDRKYCHSTTLSSYFWKMKDAGKNPKIKFRIARVIQSYTPEIGKCYLCTAEKVEIMRSDSKLTINKKNEIMGKCRHRPKFLLENFIT